MKNEFFTLGSFEYASEVQIIKGKLESEGIPVFLLNENTLNSDPMISNAIGGVKIQVYTRDKEVAKTIFDAIKPYAVDNDGELLKCPNCSREKLEAYYSRKSVFYKLFPFFEKKKYQCQHCQMITQLENE